jgi:hypothetical protein
MSQVFGTSPRLKVAGGVAVALAAAYMYRTTRKKPTKKYDFCKCCEWVRRHGHSPSELAASRCMTWQLVAKPKLTCVTSRTYIVHVSVLVLVVAECFINVGLG